MQPGLTVQSLLAAAVFCSRRKPIHCFNQQQILQQQEGSVCGQSYPNPAWSTGRSAVIALQKDVAFQQLQINTAVLYHVLLELCSNIEI